MKNNKIVQKIEALLFVVGEEGCQVKELASSLNTTKEEVEAGLSLLSEKYISDSMSALFLLETAGKYKLSTKKEVKEVLEEYVTSPNAYRLSQAVLETLSIVAYKQPLPRIKVDEIRGVSSSGVLQKLVHLQLIEEKGRLETPGRPILYGTTEYFMDYFGINSLEELPDVTAMEQEVNENVPVDLFFERYKDKDLLFEEEYVDEETEKYDEVIEENDEWKDSKK